MAPDDGQRLAAAALEAEIAAVCPCCACAECSIDSADPPYDELRALYTWSSVRPPTTGSPEVSGPPASASP